MSGLHEITQCSSPGTVGIHNSKKCNLRVYFTLFNFQPCLKHSLEHCGCLTNIVCFNYKRMILAEIQIIDE